MKKILKNITEISESKVKKKLSQVIFLGTALLLTLSFVMPALAITHYGVFELDGNATTDSTNTAVNDWQDLFGFPSLGFPPIHQDHSIARVFLNDTNSTPFGDVEFSGNTKDIEDISAWTWTAHEPQTKVTFNDTYAAGYNVNGNTIVEFGADRIDSSGAANEGFWFLQNPISLNSNGTFNGTHKNGDILVISSFTVGGTVSTIEVLKWNSSDTANNSLTPQLQLGTNVTCAPGLATSNVNLCAAVNSGINGYPGIIPAPWPYATASTFPALSATFPVNTFMEGGLNITAVLPQNSLTGQCITTFVAETRSSPSTTATLSDFMLGNFNLCGTISGVKFNDLNGNGKLDPGEPGLANWTINLINSTGAIVNTTTTANDGTFNFGTQILPGTYTLSEVLQPGWIQTAAINGTSAVSAFPNITVNLAGGGGSTGNKFGNFQNGSIYGMKFNDINSNGALDANEPGLGGWTINLDGTDTITGSTVHLTTITASDGTFNFTNLTNGTYALSEVLKPGWKQTAAINGTSAVSAFPNITVNIQSGTNSTGNSFGNFQLGSISGLKFNDLNGNGIKDPGEPILASWSINLFNSAGVLVASNITATDGSFSFNNLTADTYTLSEVLQTGWVQTATIAGTNANIAGSTITVKIQSGTVSSGNMFGNFQLGSISGLKFNDLNDNGSLDANESGLGGWTINLDGTDTITGSTVHKTATTASDGTFNFTNLTNGTYTLSEQLQNGWIQTAAIPGNNASAAFPNITVNIQSGTNSTNNTFGNFQLRHLSFIKAGSLNMSDGKMLNYTINATNDGFAPLDILNITDPTVGQLSCTPSLSPTPTLNRGDVISCVLPQAQPYSVTNQIPNINAPTVIEFEVNGTTTPINLSI